MRIQEVQKIQAKYYNKKQKPQQFWTGNKVFLIGWNIKTTKSTKKLDYKQYSPLEILTSVGRQAYKLALPPTFHSIYLVFHVSLLKKCNKDPIPGQTVESPPPLVIDMDGEQYLVEQILDSQIRYSKLQYLLC
jgi:hypothetical protein